MKAWKLKRLALVTWLDSKGGNTWEIWDENSEFEPATCQSVGWIIERDSKVLLLANRTVGDEKTHVCGDMCIPMEAVVKIETLIKRK